MRVSHLSLRDFRNYQQAELELQPGPNLIIGRNGQGKTNLVEAIAYFATLSSHRATGDVPLIRKDCDAAVMRLAVRAGERGVSLETQLNRRGQNRAQVNGNPVRARELTRWFAAVAFVPEDLALVRGEPGVRRRFMDDSLTVRLPLAGGVISDYERVVKQRTSLLKSLRRVQGGAADGTLAVWNDKLAELGTRIILARRELVRDLSAPLASAYADLVGSDHSPRLALKESVSETLAETRDVSRETFEIETADNPEKLLEYYQQALADVREREIERGVTLVGPHRDDLLLQLNDLPVKGYASHGESWSFALSMKLALASVLRAESPAGDPVIILDDVFAELDANRRERLMLAVQDYEQVIVTAAVEGDVPDHISWHRVRVEAGQLA